MGGIRPAPGEELCECVQGVGGRKQTSPCGAWGWVWATAWEPGTRGAGRACREMEFKGFDEVPQPRQRRRGLCVGLVTRQEAAPEARGAPTRPGPGRASPSEGGITVPGTGHASPRSPDSNAPARSMASSALEAGDRRGGRASGGTAQRGGGKGVAGDEGDTWSLGSPG